MVNQDETRKVTKKSRKNKKPKLTTLKASTNNVEAGFFFILRFCVIGFLTGTVDLFHFLKLLNFQKYGKAFRFPHTSKEVCLLSSTLKKSRLHEIFLMWNWRESNPRAKKDHNCIYVCRIFIGFKYLL